MNSRALILTLSLFAVIAAASAAGLGKRGALVGGYSPIKNIHDAHVQEIAKYAVSEHNKKSGDKLTYQKTVKGESQVVAGTNYRLEIIAKNGAAVGNYQAVVYEKVWESYRSLTSFHAV
ncbi:cysteine proteinase inhibitor 1-like [Silene latifolia]|uniref:cysteine proteinase inhibitor 1-like n=1 Tax=Silene latifolia TaxID=37657 RepID=UPI003D76BB1F